jgi:hypothetical protein
MHRKSFVFIATLLLTLAASQATAAPVKLFYPDQANADFSIDVPGDWELEQADEEGGFFTVTGPTGAALSFRTIPTRNAEIKAAIKQSVEWVFENYEDVELGDPEDIKQNGMDGFNMTGTATDASSGESVVIVMGWLGLKPSALAEVLVILDPSDKQGLAAAERVIKTLRRR